MSFAKYETHFDKSSVLRNLCHKSISNWLKISSWNHSNDIVSLLLLVLYWKNWKQNTVRRSNRRDDCNGQEKVCIKSSWFLVIFHSSRKFDQKPLKIISKSDEVI